MSDEARYRGFDLWSGRLLLVALVLSVVGSFLVLTAVGDVLAWLRLGFAALQVPAIAALLVTVSGLGSGKSWARPAAVGILAVLLAIGIVEIAAALGRSSIHFPLLAIAALVVLWRAPSGSILSGSLPADRVRVATLVALYLVPLVGNQVLGWATVPGRTPLAVGPEALNASVDLDCGTGGSAPDEIRATFAWRWTERDLFPGGVDGVLLRWEFVEPEMPGMRYVVREVPRAGYYNTGSSASNEMDGEIWVGSRGHALLEDVIGEGFRALSLGVHVDRQGMRDDAILLILRPDGPAPPPRHAVIDFWGSYAHLDRWARQSETVSCRW